MDNAAFPSRTASGENYDLDGDLDLYIDDEEYPCQLFENQRGRFQDVAQAAGVENLRSTTGVVWDNCDGDR